MDKKGFITLAPEGGIDEMSVANFDGAQWSKMW
jgi:hypothetical protein